MKTDAQRTLATVAVVDDEPTVRDSLRRLLESAGHSVETFGSAEDFETDVDREDLGCVLLDVSLPGIGGIELLDRLGSRPAGGPAAPVVMISGRAEVPDAVKAMKAGASEFLLKPLVSDDVLSAVDRSLAEFRRQAVMTAQERDAHGRIASLTRRETEVLKLIVAGRLNKQMASELGISQKTVEFHRARVMRKLDVSCMAELMRVAFLGGVRDLYEEPATATADASETLVEA